MIFVFLEVSGVFVRGSELKLHLQIKNEKCRNVILLLLQYKVKITKVPRYVFNDDNVCVCVCVFFYLQGVEENEDVGHNNGERHQDTTQPRQSEDGQQHQNCFYCCSVHTHSTKM